MNKDESSSQDIKLESAFTIKRWTTFPLILAIMLALSWVLTQARGIIPEQFYSMDMMVLYVSWFVLTGMTWTWWILLKHKERMPLLDELFKSSILRAVPSMIMAALISIFVFWLLFEVVLGMSAKNFSWELVPGLIFLFGFVVAPVEEIIFRYMWPCLLGGYFSQFIYAGFHVVVNNWNLNLFAFNLLFGIVMWELYMNKPPQLKSKLIGVEKPKVKKWIGILFYFGLGPLIVIHSTFNIMLAFYGGIT